jgi:hypothetical protein
MIAFRTLFLAFMAIWILSGCAYRNNYPIKFEYPEVQRDSATMRLYVDANGTFFPEGWAPRCAAKCKPLPNGFSLLQSSVNAPQDRARIMAEEARQQALAATFMTRHARIFVLVHGFNTDAEDARQSYLRVLDRIALTPSDGVIEFYWDGLVELNQKTPVSVAPLRFWSTAALNSQVGGSRGLRRILALAKRRDLFIISHSRGASVVLSALSNPPYDKGDQARFERRDFDLADAIAGSPGFLNPPPLPRGAGNNIRLLMLAPAVGCIDFSIADIERRRAKDMDAEGCNAIRPLHPDVTFFGHTINPEDSALGKYILPSSWYRATDFGYKSTLSAYFATRWKALESFLIEVNPHGHDFDCYANDLEFGKMLGAAGLTLNPKQSLSPRKPCGRKPKAQPKP